MISTVENIKAFIKKEQESLVYCIENGINSPMSGRHHVQMLEGQLELLVMSYYDGELTDNEARYCIDALDMEFTFINHDSLVMEDGLTIDPEPYLKCLSDLKADVVTSIIQAK